MSEADVAIRRATLDDVPTLVEHRVAMFRDIGALPVGEEAALRAAVLPVLADWLAMGEYVAWVVTAAGNATEVIGGAGVQRRHFMPRPSPTGVLSGGEGLVLNVYVEPGWRKRGVGGRVMREVIAWARSEGIEQLVLHASAEGRPMYEKLGFAQTNEMRLA